jgi:hypothetical protein
VASDRELEQARAYGEAQGEIKRQRVIIEHLRKQGNAGLATMLNSLLMDCPLPALPPPLQAEREEATVTVSMPRQVLLVLGPLPPAEMMRQLRELAKQEERPS